MKHMPTAPVFAEVNEGNEESNRNTLFLTGTQALYRVELLSQGPSGRAK
jgi:hypothetical protein